MTGAEFSSRYKLLRKVTTEGVNSYHAQHAVTGQAAMVHIHSNVTVDDLRAKLEKLDRNDRDKILEIVEVDGSAVAVTQFIQNFRTFEEWSAEKARPRAQTQTHAAPPVSPTKDGPGEFTQMFQAASPSAASAATSAPLPPQAPSAAAPPPPPPPPPPKPQAAPAGGESFTQLFGGASSQFAPAPAPPPVVPPRANPVPPPPPVRPAPPQPAPAQEPSFTQMFLQPNAGSSAPPPSYPPQVPSQNRSPFGGDQQASDSPWAEGGLPAALQPAKSSQLPPPLASPGAGRGSFTEILNSVSPAAPSAPPPPPMPPPMPRAATGPSAAQPSDFTRIVNATPGASRAVDAPGAPVAPRAPAPAPAAASPAAKASDDKKMKSFVIMMALVNVLFTLVVGLILFLVLR